jgi:hypothetical protein
MFFEMFEIIKKIMTKKYFVYSVALDNIKKEYKEKIKVFVFECEERLNNLQSFLILLSEEKIKVFGYEISFLSILFFCVLVLAYATDNAYYLASKINN